MAEPFAIAPLSRLLGWRFFQWCSATFLTSPNPSVRVRASAKKKRKLFSRGKEGKCNGCAKKFDMRNMAVDHIKPFAHGHGERLNNLQLLCTACNSLKGTGTMAQLKKKLRGQGVIKSAAKTSATSKKKQGTTTAPKARKRPAAKKQPTQPRDPFADLLDIFS